MSGPLTDDPEALGELIEKGEAAGGGSGGAPLGGPGSDLHARMMNNSPDPDINNVKPYEVKPGYSLRYLRRGIGKFTGAGSTAAEDFALAAVNGAATLWYSFTSAPDNQTAATTGPGAVDPGGERR